MVSGGERPFEVGRLSMNDASAPPRRKQTLALPGSSLEYFAAQPLRMSEISPSTSNKTWEETACYYQKYFRKSIAGPSFSRPF
jgi:hypothetical protein